MTPDPELLGDGSPVPKLCLGTHPGAPGLRFAIHHGKQSFRKMRDQAELGHEET